MITSRSMPRGAARRPAARRDAPERGGDAVVPVPFDYAVSFEVTGQPGNLLEGALTISPDSVFVATAIGYGLDEGRGRDLVIRRIVDPPPPTFLPGDVKLSQLPANALIEGFRVSPDFERAVFLPENPAGVRSGKPVFSNQPLTDAARDEDSFRSKILERFKPGGNIVFQISIVDTSTGRELQDEPAFSLASLGKSNGERPFRPLAHPVAFEPHSTIRFQVIERSEDTVGTLFVVLYGYKLPGLTVCPEPMVLSLAATGGPTLPLPRRSQVIPFDYVSKFLLEGTPGQEVADEIVISVEGGFIATSIGYGLAPDHTEVTIQPPASGNPDPDLGNVTLSRFPTDALAEGVRIRPNYLRLAFQDNGNLSTNLDTSQFNNIFERLNRPDDVSFRYFLFDSSRKDLQNIPIHNIAGLGIADGDRPFKRFARPLNLQPRSKLRITVTEHVGRGLLFIVLHGYKVLGGRS